MSPTYRDEVLQFACEGAPLLGILSLPEQAQPWAVLVIVGGPQYRVGAHRQFVLLARHLAAAGYPVLRFDHRGIGDSTTQHPGFDQTGPDIQAAIEALFARLPLLRGVMLWGLCDAASAALIYHEHYRDPRVKGLALVNPWVRSTHTLARTHVKHYYLDRLRQASFWRKLVRGEVTRGVWRELLHNLRMVLTPPQRSEGGFQQLMAQAWQKFPGPLLLVLSDDDYTAKEFVEVVAHQPAWRGALQRSCVQRVDITGADHTFSSAANRARLEQATLDWLRRLPS